GRRVTPTLLGQSGLVGEEEIATSRDSGGMPEAPRRLKGNESFRLRTTDGRPCRTAGAVRAAVVRRARGRRPGRVLEARPSAEAAGGCRRLALPRGPQWRARRRQGRPTAAGPRVGGRPAGPM